MSMNDYLKCPGVDRTLYAIPETHKCPDCGNEVEIWTDEKKGKCKKCGAVVRNKNFQLGEDNINIGILKELARSMGASDAELIDADDILVEDKLANRCTEPRCSNYGLSPSCPPHVSGPGGFREMQNTFEKALVSRIIIPTSIFFSSERKELGRLNHEIVAAIEQEAIEMGYSNSKAFAGGSCKNIFCSNHADCRVLTGNGECRNPQYARPSMSGFGINVFELMKTCGWNVNVNEDQEESGTESMSWIAGLVLIGK